MNHYSLSYTLIGTLLLTMLNMGSSMSYILMSAFLVGLLKIVASRTHYLVFLLLVEIMMLVMYCLILMEGGLSSSSSIQIMVFMTLMVCGACLGMSMLVAVSRSFSKDMELYFLKI